jgi:uncharacterized protein (TIRG00374 family)
LSTTTPLPSDAPLLSHKLKQRLLIGVAFGACVYLGIALWADGPGIAAALASFPLKWVAAACGLSFTNYCVRFLRWERYRALLGIRMGVLTSFRIYLAGLALTVTPGKMGEAFRSLLIQKIDGTPIARSAPMVMAERFTDLLGFLILLAIGGLASQPDYVWVFWATLGLCGVLLLLVSSTRFAAAVIGLTAKLPLVGKLSGEVDKALASTRELLAPRELLMPTVVSTLGWGLECFGFYLVSEALVPGGVDLLFAMYTFALSSIVGAVLIIFPAGLGVTEATMGGLLGARYRTAGLAADAAAAKALSAVFIIRLCTLWFAVLLGICALGLHSRLSARDNSGPATQS